MLILPAIDLRDGRCVRLRQGDYAHETVYGADPAAIAAQWAGQGAKALHLVDLDGAKAGRPTNEEAIRRILAAVSVPCQLGGGLRTEADVEAVFSWGVARAIVGTKALTDPAWLTRLAQRFPERILLGLDAKDGKVATAGWLNVSAVSASDLLRQLESAPLAGVIATDIGRDGMLTGPNLDFYRDLQTATHLPLYASGGVSSLDDLRELLPLRLAGCVVGKALYENRFDLPAALALALARGAAM